MKGMGTIVNVLAVVFASLLGLLFKKGIKERYKNMLMGVLGVSVMFIGVSGTLGEMFTVSGGKINAQGSMLLVASLVLGSLAGEALRIEDRLEGIGDKLKSKFKSDGNSGFTEGFVNATIIICVGAMAIMGSLQDGLTGDRQTLYVKSILDFFIVLIFSSAFGIGTLFSAIPLAVYQGAITLAAGAVSPYMSDRLVSNLNLVGSAMIFCIGINLAFGKKFKVGNMLPGIFVPVVYGLILHFAGK
ncbi:MAG: DUF554 domain-containing protein [Clostridia bacterium]|nr:DUF554 domain-containing protein [Clostridia bacterium]